MTRGNNNPTVPGRAVETRLGSSRAVVVAERVGAEGQVGCNKRQQFRTTLEQRQVPKHHGHSVIRTWGTRSNGNGNDSKSTVPHVPLFPFFPHPSPRNIIWDDVSGISHNPGRGGERKQKSDERHKISSSLRSQHRAGQGIDEALGASHAARRTPPDVKSQAQESLLVSSGWPTAYSPSPHKPPPPSSLRRRPPSAFSLTSSQTHKPS